MTDTLSVDGLTPDEELCMALRFVPKCADLPMCAKAADRIEALRDKVAEQEREIARARAQALEEAAKLCLVTWRKETDLVLQNGLSHGAIACARAIRALANQDQEKRELLRISDPVGVDNDEAIEEVCGGASMVVCAWGSDRAVGRRGRRVLDIIRGTGAEPHAIKVNADGNPAHPLYQSYSRLPVPFASQSAGRPECT